MSHHTAPATATAGQDSHRAVLHQGRTSIDALGPPLQPGNWANLSESCVIDPEEFKQLARPGPVRVASLARQNLQRCSYLLPLHLQGTTVAGPITTAQVTDALLGQAG